MPDDFVRDMTSGGAQFSFADLGNSYGGTAGRFAGMAGDLAFRMMYPNQSLMFQRGSEFDRMRAANNAMMLQRLQENFGRIHNAQMRSILQSRGLGPTTSSVLSAGAGFFGVAPRNAMTEYGMAGLMDMAANPAAGNVITGRSIDSVSKAFESYFGFDYRSRGIQAAGQNASRRQHHIALEKARFLERTGGLDRDSVARGLVALRNFGLMDARMSDYRQNPEGKWIDYGILGRARQELGRTLGDVEGGTLERLGVTNRKAFQSRLAEIKRKNPFMSDTEAREEALATMKGVGPLRETYSDAQVGLIRERASSLIGKYGEQAVLGGERTLARAMQMGDARSSEMFAGLKAMQDTGFVGDMNDLLAGLSEQFGQNQALNPNFIKSLASDMRSIREATGMAFSEVANYMQIVSKVPGAKGLTGVEISGIAAEGAVLFGRGATGAMSDAGRTAATADYVQIQSMIRGSPVAGLQRYLAAGGGTSADRELIQRVVSTQDPGRITALLSGRTDDGARLSPGALAVASSLRNPREREAVLKSIVNQEAIFNREFADVNREWQTLSARGEQRTDEETKRFHELTSRRDELLSQQKMVTGAAEAAFKHHMSYVRRGTKDRIGSLFGGDMKTASYFARMMLLNPEISFGDLRAQASARGMNVPEGLTDKDLAVLQTDIRSQLSEQEREHLAMAGGAAAFGRGSKRARIMSEAYSRMFASSAQAAEALKDLDDPTRQRFMKRFHEKVGGLPGILDEFGLTITGTGAIAGGDGLLSGLNLLSGEGFRTATDAQVELERLGLSYAAAASGKNAAQDVFNKELKDINARRAERGLAALTAEDFGRIKAGLGKGTLDRTEVELAMSMNFLKERERTALEARAGLIKRGRAILGEDVSESRIERWALEKIPSLEAEGNKRFLEEEEKKARESGSGQGEMVLSGAVSLVVEDDQLKLMFKDTLGKAKKPGKGG